eukprot:570842-Pelagomonas_calceolata.AAC.3
MKGKSCVAVPAYVGSLVRNQMQKHKTQSQRFQSDALIKDELHKQPDACIPNRFRNGHMQALKPPDDKIVIAKK